jgi:hypothetical protein
MMPSGRWTRRLLPALALLVIAGGCSDSTEHLGPEVPAGRIAGRVRTGDMPTDARVVAERIFGEAGSEAWYRTGLDANGFYSLDVPAGRYVVGLEFGYSRPYTYSDAGLRYGDLPPDTLWVDAPVSPVSVDFDLGSVTVQLDVSAGLEGEQGEIRLYRRGAESVSQPTYVRSAGADIASGHLAVQLPGVLPGEYQVEAILGRRVYACDCPYDGEHFWLPATRDRSESPWYRVAADSVTALTSVVTTEPARIEGSVTGAWLAMGLTTEPELSIVSVDSTVIMGRRRLVDGGTFAIDLHVPGLVKLAVTQGGIEQWFGGPGFADATVYTLQLGQTISGLELVQCGLRLVADSLDPSESAASVRLYDPEDHRLVATGGGNLGAGAIAGIPNLWPGEFLMHVSAASPGSTSWRPQWFDHADGIESAQRITITAVGEIVPVELILDLGGAMRGRVEAGEGPPETYIVVVTTSGNNACWGSDIAWSDDLAFAFAGLPDGDYKIGAIPYDHSMWDVGEPAPDGTVWYPGTADWDDAGNLTIYNASVVADIVIPVP